ncbi:MAG TPA: phosphate signaling complex protein PhoU [Tepidisphaeraceae bacterium]|nr:phosphate signaling complex protein PhoU [Tepidisphaeraceae bacterium]
MAQHFKDALDCLREKVARMTASVQLEVEQAVEAVLTANVKLARTVIDGDRRIDEEEVEIEKAAIDLLALYQPAASDLRLITTIIKVNGDFERVADCAVNVAQRVPSLASGQNGQYHPPEDLRVMGNTVVTTLRETIKAFNLPDATLARSVLRSDDVVDALYHQIVQDMVGMMEAGGQQAGLDLSNIMIAKNLERIADHCTNIAENVVYVASGRIIRHRHAAEASM